MILTVAMFGAWWQPSLLDDPVRTTKENIFYILHTMNSLLGTQGHLTLLDKLTLTWMDHNSANIPDAANHMRPEPVAVIDRSEYNPEVFRKITKNGRKPLVVRGLFQGSSAVKNWSIEHFNTTVPNVPVAVFESGHNCLENLQSDFHHRLFTQSSFCKATTNFSNYLSDMKGRYAVQVSGHFAENPQFLKDLELERLHRDVYDPKQAIIPTMFIGYGSEFPAKTHFHCAAAPNWFIQVFGHKVWRFLPPKWSPYFQPFFVKGTPAVVSRNTLYDDASFDRHNAKDLPYSEIALNPGDFLYLPGWWWHEIHHLENEYFAGVGLRPFVSTAWQFLPGVSENFAFSIGSLPEYLRALVSVLTGDDWGKRFHEKKQ